MHTAFSAHSASGKQQHQLHDWATSSQTWPQYLMLCTFTSADERNIIWGADPLTGFTTLEDLKIPDFKRH